MTPTLTHGTASLILHILDGDGRIDAFKAETEADATALIARALDTLRQAGCTRALGPIGLDTWSPYRAIIETDDTPTFPGEPATPLFYADCFIRNGFSPIETYRSTLDTDLKLPTRAPLPGLAISEWHRANPAADLAAIHLLAHAAFSDAPFFAPIDLERFSALHAPLLAGISSRYALLGRDETGAIVACLLGYPSPSGLVLKTLMSKRRGAGSALVDEFYRRAITDGHAAIIHALMHEDNRSTRMSAKRNGRVFRRYALFGRAL